jgi:uncharacterized protein (TIGR03643 family)
MDGTGLARYDWESPVGYALQSIMPPHTPDIQLSDSAISEIIEMALSDHVSFGVIAGQYGIRADAVKALMRQRLKPGSYRAWRKRIRTFGDRRAHYK